MSYNGQPLDLFSDGGQASGRHQSRTRKKDEGLPGAVENTRYCLDGAPVDLNVFFEPAGSRASSVPSLS